MEKELDETLNIGSEVKLAEGLVKNVKIGTIGVIRQVRKIMADFPYKFSTCIGREPWPGTETTKGVNWPEVEAGYRKAFDLVIDGGLSDVEYEQVDMDGIEELENIITRFL